MSQTATSSPCVTGKLTEKQHGRIELAVPGTEYRLALATDNTLEAPVGQKLTGTIHARAQRIDVIRSGGRFVEPVYGRPRRVQGRIIGGDVAANTLCVSAGGPVLICTLTAPGQKAADFAVGQMVSFDVEPGAKWVNQGAGV